MGNEFGHPEWVDFPREGNNWSLPLRPPAVVAWPTTPTCATAACNEFDQAMLSLDEQFHVLEDPLIEQLMVHEDKQLLVYRRGPLVFAFNFHPTESYPDLRIPVPDPTDYKLVLDSDAKEFGGFGRLEPGSVHPKENVPMYGRDQSVRIYLPNRTALVLAPA